MHDTPLNYNGRNVRILLNNFHHFSVPSVILETDRSKAVQKLTTVEFEVYSSRAPHLNKNPPTTEWLRDDGGFTEGEMKRVSWGTVSDFIFILISDVFMIIDQQYKYIISINRSQHVSALPHYRYMFRNSGA